MNKFEIAVIELAKEIQRLVDDEFEKLAAEPPCDHPLAQAGLKDGLFIVKDFVSHGEIGIAIEHLIYMINETPIVMNNDQTAQVIEFAAKMGFPFP